MVGRYVWYGKTVCKNLNIQNFKLVHFQAATHLVKGSSSYIKPFCEGYLLEEDLKLIPRQLSNLVQFRTGNNLRIYILWGRKIIACVKLILRRYACWKNVF